MKLLINGSYMEISFWSFVKCTLLAQLAVAGIFYGIILIFVVIGFALGGL